MAESTSPAARPRLFTMLLRGLFLRCPWCGSRRTFIRRWLGKHQRCRTCGIRWRREDGFELGPMVINIILTFAVIAVVLTVLIATTVPDIPVGPVLAVLVAIAVVLPLLLYPFTYTLWLAVDLAAHPPTEAELAVAKRHGEGSVDPSTGSPNGT